MVAARDIDQGEMIFSEEALVKGPNHTITTPHCLECLKVGTKSRHLDATYPTVAGAGGRCRVLRLWVAGVQRRVQCWTKPPD